MISPTTVLIILLLLSGTAYYIGLRRSVSVVGGQEHIRKLHSRPPYYGAMTALWCGIPALVIFAFWQAFEADIITNLMVAGLPNEIRHLPADQINLIVNDIRNLAAGNIVSSQTSQVIQEATTHYSRLQQTSHTVRLWHATSPRLLNNSRVYQHW